MSYEYLSSCCDPETAPYLDDAVAMARKITYTQFIKDVPEEILSEQFPDYNWTEDDSAGLRMRDDGAVGFYKSVYHGSPCVFLRQSGVERVYVPSDYFDEDDEPAPPRP